MEVPVARSLGGRTTVIDGLLTLVISLVGPTSGDWTMRVVSSPGMPRSPGALPGHRSTTTGTGGAPGDGRGDAQAPRPPRIRSARHRFMAVVLLPSARAQRPASQRSA